MTRPAPVDPLLVPGKVWISGDSLEWAHSRNYPARRVRTPPNLLQQFTDLRNGSDEEVAAFASKYGVLGICHHDWPRTHNLARMWPRKGLASPKLENEPEWEPGWALEGDEPNAGCFPRGLRFTKDQGW